MIGGHASPGYDPAVTEIILIERPLNIISAVAYFFDPLYIDYNALILDC